MDTFLSSTAFALQCLKGKPERGGEIFVPCHGDTRVQIVELGGAEGDLLVLLAVSGLHLQLHQLLLDPLNRLLLRLNSPTHKTPKHSRLEKCDKGRGINLSTPNLRDNSLFGLFISSYFGISLGTLQFSLGIRKLLPFSINLKRKGSV